MPLRGPQLAYYLKKRNPELYQKAREVKEKYGVTWNIAIAIAKGEAPPLPPLKTEDLSKRVEEITSAISELREKVSRVESTLTLLEELKSVAQSLRIYEELKSVLEELSKRISRIESELTLLELSSRDKAATCRWIDESGYCTKWALREVLPGWRIREETIRGVKIYRINVKEHPILCLGCLSYISRERVP